MADLKTTLKKNKTKYIIFGILIASAIFFFVPVFPVRFPNTIHTSTTLVWFSGLKLITMGFGFKNLFLHQIIGGVIGFLFPFIIIKNGK